ncbi:hypothetical protein ZIOFF_042891 [Zingiber officinale]|uniref:Uncharacterized protein n=1 Tax=Zingiber officinale TaxID=94328 RepID=A0A8J5KYB2_ZINOF|nr:hypothetical protein ZIOFF_042891 [Zingiber officinale]
MEDFFFSYAPISFAATLLLVFFLAASFHRFGKKRRLPPLKGSILHQLLYFSRIHDYHTDLAGESKTFRLLGPSRSYFYTVDPLVVEHVLRTNFAKYGKGFYNYHTLKDLLGDGIFAVDGEKWRHQRKLSSYEFSTKNLRDFSGDVFRKAAAKLAAAISNSARSNESVDIQDLFMRSTMDSIFKIGFDVELDTLSGLSKEGMAFARAFDEAGDLVLWRYADPSWMIKKLLNVGSEATLKKDIQIIDEFIYKLISNKKELLSEQQNQTVGKQDMLSRFMVEKEKDSENMNDKYLRDIILNIIIAGRDTTAITLSWFFYMLCNCKHSSLQDQLAREVEDSTAADHCCTDRAAGFTETLTEASLSKMQFLHAALTETLRLHPAIPEVRVSFH